MLIPKRNVESQTTSGAEISQYEFAQNQGKQRLAAIKIVSYSCGDHGWRHYDDH